MNILCIAQVEDRANLDKQIAKQTMQPTRVIYYVDKHPAKGIDERRKRIAVNHKRLMTIVEAYQPDLVWQLEGDVDLPVGCLEILVQNYLELSAKDGKHFGYISGIQVGRHGLYCLGAWRNFTPDSFESLDYTLTGIQKVEATGFYCLLAPKDVWLSGKCSWNNEPYGCDVVWGRSIKQNKYVNMSLTIGHIIKGGIIRPEHKSTTTAKFRKINDKWEYKVL